MLNAYMYYIYGPLAIGKTFGDDLRVARVVVRWCIGRKVCYYWCDRSLTAELPQMTRAGPHIPHRFSETSTTFSPPSVLSVHFLLLPLLLSSAHPPCWLFFCFFILFHVDFPSPSYIPQIKKISLNSFVLFKLISPWYGHILLCLYFLAP